MSRQASTHGGRTPAVSPATTSETVALSVDNVPDSRQLWRPNGSPHPQTRRIHSRRCPESGARRCTSRADGYTVAKPRRARLLPRRRLLRRHVRRSRRLRTGWRDRLYERTLLVQRRLACAILCLRHRTGTGGITLDPGPHGGTAHGDRCIRIAATGQGGPVANRSPVPAAARPSSVPGSARSAVHLDSAAPASKKSCSQRRRRV